MKSAEHMRGRSKSEDQEGSAEEEEEGKIRRRSRSERMYRGVRMRKWGRWVSEIRMPNKKGRIWLGSYDSAHKAALAYDLAAFCLRGYAATLNFPNSPPPATALPPAPYSPRRIQTAASSFALLSDNIVEVGSPWLPALDTAVLDSLASFLEAHSHTKWWLG